VELVAPRSAKDAACGPLERGRRRTFELHDDALLYFATRVGMLACDQERHGEARRSRPAIERGHDALEVFERRAGEEPTQLVSAFLMSRTYERLP
jgi:hypothetical protein